VTTFVAESDSADLNSAAVGALRDMVFAGRYERVEASVRAAIVLLHASAESGVPQAERARRAYDQLRELTINLGTAREIIADPPRLFALFDWAAIAAPDLFPILSGHFNLTVAAIQRLGSGTAHQLEQLRLLDDAGHAGVFLLTELGYGSNVLDMETEATWDPVLRCFRLSTPSGAACKFMPNVAADGVPKITVVAARLKVDGNDEGIFPFIVPLRTAAGPAKGVDIVPMPDKGFGAMDNAMIRFDRVALPYDAWLSGGIARIDGDGSFVCSLRPRDRFHRTLEQLQAGRIALSSGVVASARAALWLTVRYAARRRTAGGILMLERDNVWRDLASSAARIYAVTALANEVRQNFADPAADLGKTALLAMLAKPVLTNTAMSVLQVCRERCGAQSMFRINRIPDWIGVAQGVLTAEGENQILQVSAGRVIGRLLGVRSTDLTLDVEPADVWWRRLLTAREQALAGAFGIEDEALSVTPAVGPSSHAMDLAEAIGDRLAADALWAAARTAAPEIRGTLESMAAVYALERIQRHAAWSTATGHLTAQVATEVERQLVLGYRATAACLPQLVDAFEIPDLGAPIAGDYISGWLRYAGWEQTGQQAPAVRNGSHAFQH
jgi:acyl-CoA oxidase